MCILHRITINSENAFRWPLYVGECHLQHILFQKVEKHNGSTTTLQHFLVLRRLWRRENASNAIIFTLDNFPCRIRMGTIANVIWFDVSTRKKIVETFCYDKRLDSFPLQTSYSSPNIIHLRAWMSNVLLRWLYCAYKYINKVFPSHLTPFFHAMEFMGGWAKGRG